MLTWRDIRNDEQFWGRFRAPGRNVLMLDYDGTLAPFRIDPGEAVPYPGVRESLIALQTASSCRLVFVTGRIVWNLADLLRLPRPPEIWGSHGAERLHEDGAFDPVRMRPVQQEGLDEAVRLAQAAGFANRLESKPGCRAIHWRGVPEGDFLAIQETLRPALQRLAETYDLRVHDFDGGMELRIPGLDKGRPVRRILEEERDARVVFLGDDLTDEDAFRELAKGTGNGVGVLVRPKPRSSLARVWLKPPEELLEFLRVWVTVCSNTIPMRTRPVIQEE